MGIDDRIRRLISGTVNRAIARVEDSRPDVVLEENLREMRAARTGAQHDLGAVLVTKHNTKRSVARNMEVYESLSQKLAVALENSRDDLAKAVIGRQIDCETQQKVFADTMQRAEEDEASLRETIEALDATIRERSEQLNEFRQKANAAKSEDGTQIAAALSGSTYVQDFSEADESFRTTLERQTGLIDLPPDLDSAVAIQELSELERVNTIDKRLAQAKMEEEDAGASDSNK